MGENAVVFHFTRLAWIFDSIYQVRERKEKGIVSEFKVWLKATIKDDFLVGGVV